MFCFTRSLRGTGTKREVTILTSRTKHLILLQPGKMVMPENALRKAEGFQGLPLIQLPDVYMIRAGGGGGPLLNLRAIAVKQ